MTMEGSPQVLQFDNHGTCQSVDQGISEQDYEKDTGN